MGIFPIGHQRVGVVTETITGYDPEYNGPIRSEVVLWVDGCCFEIQTPTEEQNQSVTTSEIGWAFFPIVDGALPAVDDDGDPAPLQLLDADHDMIRDDNGSVVLNSGLVLRHNGLSYVMRGDAVLMQTIRGRDDHVFAKCERERG